MRKFGRMNQSHFSRKVEIDEAISLFLNSKKLEKKSEETIKTYQGGLARFKKWLTENGYEDLNRNCLESYVHYLTYEKSRWGDHPMKPTIEGINGLSSRSVNNAVRILKMFLAYLEREGYIDKNPIAALKFQHVEENDFHIFSEEQIRNLLNVPDKLSFAGYRDYVMMLVLLDTGIRIGELTRLVVSDIDFTMCQITLRWEITKTKRTRILPLSETVVKELQRLVAYCKLVGDVPLWLTQYGEPYSARVFAKALEINGRKAGIEGVRCSPHTFRHTFATMYLLNGGDPFSLQKILGHSSMEMVLVYVNLTNKNLHDQHLKFSPVANIQPQTKKRGTIRFK